jgi:sugar phosphate isomerase/epimerase
MKNETTRRSFIGGTAGLLGVAVAGASPAASDKQSAGFRLGVATYSFRKFDRATTIKNCKELGLNTVSVKEFHLPYKSSKSELEQGRKEFTDAGLQIVSGGNITLQNGLPDMKTYFEYAKTCGMPMIVCAPTHDNIDALEACVKEYGIKAAIHNHGPEDKYYPTPQSVLEVVKGRDPRLGLCLDVGHTARTGVDVVQSIALAGDRLLEVHAKDLRDLSKKESQCDVGDGAMPIAKIFEQLKKMGFRGNVNLEYEINADNPMPGMQKSFSFMRGVLSRQNA